MAGRAAGRSVAGMHSTINHLLVEQSRHSGDAPPGARDITRLVRARRESEHAQQRALVQASVLLLPEEPRERRLPRPRPAS
jgi:hypothetical protein